ncbi:MULTISPECIES: serine O-acetyltransferase [Maricaulis]|jgi:serine O-acetyltransferase|uniref:Serine acetyltransferase n=1 Tax=Maricaulis maris (strain MCS10) TaxID=394221 RepID=Q0AQS7_MARMM|nr:MULTISPECIES: serine O-acetyltransferase [Maricaulis]ABI65360.1 serine O-acetyltransferase [Maricaulis maris MCS10]MAC88445.1 serine O-acetyltransferase [Maricaulis sp.]
MSLSQVEEPVEARTGIESIWARLRVEAASAAAEEPILASFLNAAILRHDKFSGALAYRIAAKLADAQLDSMLARDVAEEALAGDPDIVQQAAADMIAIDERDPACLSLLQPFLYFKGYHALQAHRVAHWLWNEGRQTLAFHLQSRVGERFGLDIHPAARIGRGVMLDHATSVVIGETAVVGDNCSILHEVTLGGTGAAHEDRHPKIGKGVLIGAGARVLGNITVGDGARIAAGSVVLHPVPAGCTVAGVPAKIVGNCCDEPAKSMDQSLPQGSG